MRALRLPSIPYLNAETRLRLAVQAACLAFVVTLLISVPAFVRDSTRLFALAPIWETAARTPYWTDIPVFYAAVAGFLIAFLWQRKFWILALALAIPLYWVLQDWGRVQPAFIMFAFTMLAGILRPKIGEETALDMLRWMVAGVYFWAGFHKFNVTFITQIFPWFVDPYVSPQWIKSGPGAIIFGMTAILTPYFELLIGVLLLFPKTRRIATLMAATMLFVVLACLGPFGHNYAPGVWPWNVFLFSLEWLLFYRYSDTMALPVATGKGALWLPIIIFCLLPAMALFDRWDALPSFKLYSGNILTGKLILDEKEPLDKLPPTLFSALADHDLNIPQLTYNTMRGTPYPEERVYMKGVQPLCALLTYPESTILRMQKPAPFYSLTHPHYDLYPCRKR